MHLLLPLSLTCCKSYFRINRLLWYIWPFFEMFVAHRKSQPAISGIWHLRIQTSFLFTCEVSHCRCKQQPLISSSVSTPKRLTSLATSKSMLKCKNKSQGWFIRNTGKATIQRCVWTDKTERCTWTLQSYCTKVEETIDAKGLFLIKLHMIHLKTFLQGFMIALHHKTPLTFSEYKIKNSDLHQKEKITFRVWSKKPSQTMPCLFPLLKVPIWSGS